MNFTTFAAVAVYNIDIKTFIFWFCTLVTRIRKMLVFSFDFVYTNRNIVIKIIQFARIPSTFLASEMLCWCRFFQNLCTSYNDKLRTLSRVDETYNLFVPYFSPRHLVKHSGVENKSVTIRVQQTDLFPENIYLPIKCTYNFLFGSFSLKLHLVIKVFYMKHIQHLFKCQFVYVLCL